jgi:adenylate cyclase
VPDRDYALLIIDDEPFNHALIKGLLEAEGFTNLRFAASGAEGLDLVRTQAIDLIVLDIDMPELDGFGVLKNLKTDMATRHIPVIMVSAIDDIESIAKCIELGAEDYLPKPFSRVLLRARIGASLEKKSTHDREEAYVRKISDEKKRSDQLLNVILPAPVASELKATGRVVPRGYDNVALLFCDIAGFTTYCDNHTAEEVVSRLQALIETFEDITRRHQMEKIKTIGDGYMASAGLVVPNADPLLSAVKCGLEMSGAVASIEPTWQIRAGVNSGPVIAGIVGGEIYQFDVWGDTVNVAARMERHGKPGSVTVPHEAWLQIQGDCQGRTLGSVPVKGKGMIEIIEVYGVR